MDDTTFFRMMKDNNPRMFEFIRENINESIREGNTPSEPKEENFLTMDASQETSPEEEVETPPQEMRERPPEEMGDPEEMAMEQIPTEEGATI